MASSSWKHKVKYMLLPAQITICGIIFLNDSFLEVLAVTGASMQPTLSPSYRIDGARDFVLWNKRDPARNLQRGDVVLFHAPHKPDSLSVKRVVALGGDTVLLDTRRRPEDVMNGVVNEAAKKWDIQFYRNKGRVQVPENHVWVEGDNWRSSNDSNAYGPISRGLILGKARCLVWPMQQFGNEPWEQWPGRRTKVVPAPQQRKVDGAEASYWNPQ
ncbi:Putative peptidase S26A, signal peptidase I, lexA/Signal peptidase-like superfamily [Septoria linicola]|uniref:Mitochondrial inner membrane protease subunit n=1 Tax=Septoria linicola TaxID=215465 RepID=A0A9Q9APZ1_9PEZI|nr:Putative peptidase S26A, signal peptidase I, lexA/Signal peptidase-like superfamily [Septoria linicola]